MIRDPTTRRIEDGSCSIAMSSTWRVLWPRVLNALLFICTSVLLGRWLVHISGRAAGWYLKRHASTRKKAILRRVKVEEEAFQNFNRHSQKPAEDDDWEQIESYGAASAKNGGQAEDEWEGIVGFFHPFWYVGSMLEVL